MNKIYYQHLPGNLEAALRELSGKFHLIDSYEGPAADDVVLCLLGEHQPNLIHRIQKISQKDPDIGIIAIPVNPLQNNQLKIAIRFSPFISPHVRIPDALSPEAFKKLVEQEAALTVTRKKFHKIREQVIVKTAFTPGVRIKSRFFDQFLAQAPVGIVLLDNKHKVLDTNQQATKLFGDYEEMLSAYFPALFQDQQKTIEQLLQSGDESQPPVTLAVQVSGRPEIHVQVYLSQVVSASATFKMVILLDVTRQVRAEQKVQDNLVTLENHNKELEQFAYILSHDLKSPLSTIQLSSDLAKMQSTDQKDHLLEVISRSASNLHQMIEGLEELIDVRKTTEGKKLASVIRFQDLLNKVLDAYQLQLETQEIELIANFHKAPTIRHIESYLNSIFHNMISNAIKYRKEGKPLKIIITSEKQDNFTLLQFSDNGIGIDVRKHQAHLFQPFRRFTSQAQGKGIGLSIIKSMIELNNGRLTLESEVGKGTTFYCYLCPYP